MAKAYKCDECGQFLTGSAQYVSKFVTAGKVKVRFRLTAQADDMGSYPKVPHLCPKCFRAAMWAATEEE